MSNVFETASLVVQGAEGEIRLLPVGTVLVADVEDGVLMLLKTERCRLVALSIIDDKAFPAVWYLIQRWPAAGGYAELLALFDGMSAEEEADIIDAALKASLLDTLAGDFQREVAEVSKQLAVLGLEIMEVEEFGFKIRRKETEK